MAIIDVTITMNTGPNVTANQAVQVLSTYWGYQTTINGSPNPQTRSQFVKQRIAQFTEASYRAAKIEADVETARQAAITAANEVTAT